MFKGMFNSGSTSADAEFGDDNVHSLENIEELADPERAAAVCLDLMLQYAIPDDPRRSADDPYGAHREPITRLQRNAFYFCVGPESAIAPTVEQDPELADRIERALYARLVRLVRESDVLDPWLRQEDRTRSAELRSEDPDEVEGWLRDHLALYIEIVLSGSQEQWQRNGLGWRSAEVVLCVHRWSVRPYFEQARRINAEIGVTPVFVVGMVHLTPVGTGRVGLNLHTREHYDPQNLPILSNMAGAALTLGGHPANDVVVEPPEGVLPPQARILFANLHGERDGAAIRVRGRIDVTPLCGLRKQTEPTVQRLLVTDGWGGVEDECGPSPAHEVEIVRCILQTKAFQRYDPSYFRPYVRPLSRTLPRAGEYPCYGRIPESDVWAQLTADGFDTVVEVLQQVALAARPRQLAAEGAAVPEEGEDSEVMVVVPANFRELSVTIRGERVDQVRLPRSGLGAYRLETGTLLEMEDVLRARWISAASHGGLPVRRFHGELRFEDDRGRMDVDLAPPALASFAAAGAAVLSATAIEDRYLSRAPANAAVLFSDQYGSAALVLPYNRENWSRAEARPAYPALFLRVGGADAQWQAWHPDEAAERVLMDDGHEVVKFGERIPHHTNMLHARALNRRFEVIVGSTRYLVAPRNTP